MNVEFEVTHGCPIVLGHIAVEGDEGLAIAPHDRLVLGCRVTHPEKPVWLKAVTESKVAGGGFYQLPIAGGVTMTLPFTIADLRDLGKQAREGVITRLGHGCGSLGGRPIAELRMTKQCFVEGTNFRMEGRLEAGGALREARFVAAFTALHRQTTLAGFVLSRAYLWQPARWIRNRSSADFDQTPSRVEPRNPVPLDPDDPERNTGEVNSLMIDNQGHAILKGGLEVYPRAHKHVRFTPTALVSWNNQTLGRDHIGFGWRFSSVSHVFLLPDGHVAGRASEGGGRGRIAIHLPVPTLEMLDRGLLGADRYEFYTAGTDLGEIIYRNGFPPAGSAHNPTRQNIARMDCVGQLNEHGLTLDVRADLHGFDAPYLDWLTTYCRIKVEPLTHFVLRATLPWPLILARQFLLSRHASRFGGPGIKRMADENPDEVS